MLIPSVISAKEDVNPPVSKTPFATELEKPAQEDYVFVFGWAFFRRFSSGFLAGPTSSRMRKRPAFLSPDAARARHKGKDRLMDAQKNKPTETAETAQYGKTSAAAERSCLKKRMRGKTEYLYLFLVVFLAGFVVFTALDASVLKWPCMTKAVDKYGWTAAPLGAFGDLFYYVPFRLWTLLLDSQGQLE